MSETTTIINVSDILHSVHRLPETSCVHNYFILKHVRSHRTCTGCSKYEVINAFVESRRSSLFQDLDRTL
jgi:hypothetical protein